MAALIFFLACSFSSSSSSLSSEATEIPVAFETAAWPSPSRTAPNFSAGFSTSEDTGFLAGAELSDLLEEPSALLEESLVPDSPFGASAFSALASVEVSTDTILIDPLASSLGSASAGIAERPIANATATTQASKRYFMFC